MATISSLSVLAKGSVSAADYLLTANSSTPTNNKFLLSDLFPTVNTLGTSSESLFVSITNKNALNFKGIKSLNSLLTVATASNNITLQVNESAINLANCSNVTSAFLSAVSLTGAYISGTLPVANGGTGATTLTANSLLLGNGTSALSALGVATNGQIPIGRTGLGPALATLTAGTNVTITNASGSITIAASLSSFTGNVNAAGYNLYGAGWISGDGGNEGIKIDSNGKIFIGSSTPASPFFTGDLNVKQHIYLDGSLGQYIKSSDTTSPKTLRVSGSSATAAAAGGAVEVNAGNSSGANQGGSVIVTPGSHDGTGTSGDVLIYGNASTGIPFEAARVKGTNGYLGVGTTSPSTPAHIKQTDASGNVPVLTLEQIDTTDPLINFVGTSGAASANTISSSTASAGAKTGAIQVKINGTIGWIRIYDSAV